MERLGHCCLSYNNDEDDVLYYTFDAGAAAALATRLLAHKVIVQLYVCACNRNLSSI